MTISSTVNRTSTVGDATVTAFSFPYLFFADNDLKVILVTTATGVEVVQTITTHYTITGAGVAAGGVVTMVTAPASTETLVIIREEQFTQTLDLVENDPFPSDLVEQQLDTLTMLAQQMNTEVGRSVKLADGDTSGASTTLATPVANGYLLWDAAGTALTSSSTTAGQFLGSNGTVSLPFYSFSSDPNTGLYRIGADNMGVSMGGTRIGNWASTGLSVTGTIAASGAVTGAAGTFSGILKTDNTTDATTGTDGSLQTDGGLSVAKAAYIGTTAKIIGVTTHGGNVVSDTDSTDDLGTTSVRWKELFVDGITATDQITATGFTGTLDGILGSGSASAATVTTLEVTSLSGTGAVAITDILDEDNMASNSATKLSTQQSIKAYVDAQVTASDLDFAGGTGTGAVDLDSQTFTVAGTANEIETAASGQTITVGLPANVTIAGVTTHGGNVVSDTDSTDSLGTTGVRWAGTWTDAINGVTAPTAQYTSAEETKLAGIETAADVTDATNVAAALSNGVAALTSGEVTQLANIGTEAISAAEWGYVAASTQAYDAADHSKLNGIEALADVTDATNVLAGLVGQEAVATGFTGTLDGVLGGGTPSSASVTTLTINGDITTTTSGTGNFVAGVNAGNSIESGGNFNVMVGNEAGTDTTTGDNNVAVGYAAFDANITGVSSVAVGYAALGANTTGYSNVAVGASALVTNIGGIRNTALGGSALLLNTSGNTNVAVGYNVLKANTEGTNNVAVGYNSLAVNTTGDSNVAIGALALDANTTADSNTAVGYAALTADTDGFNNTAVGRDAGGAVTTGDNNSFLGHDAGITGSPGGAITTANNQMCLGDENIANAHIQVDWTVASDKRDKTEVTPLVMGLDFINKLEPVTYRWDKRSKYSKDQDVTPDGTHKEAQLDVGFLAQDVEELEKEYGFNFEDKTNLTTNISDDEKMYGLKYSKFVPALVKAVQELTAKVKELEGKLND